jgi:hypothetical protein
MSITFNTIISPPLVSAMLAANLKASTAALEKSQGTSIRFMILKFITAFGHVRFLHVSLGDMKITNRDHAIGDNGHIP